MKNVIKIFNYIMGFICMASACALDSEAMEIPFITFMISGAYLVIYARVQGWMQ